MHAIRAPNLIGTDCYVADVRGNSHENRPWREGSTDCSPSWVQSLRWLTKVVMSRTDVPSLNKGKQIRQRGAEIVAHDELSSG